MKPTLVTLEDWPLWPERCPADVDFVDWGEHVEGLTIFHMGPGTHHIVGRTLCEANIILSITCCPAEMECYMSWAVENPDWSGRYRCLFGDIYMTDELILPRFDVVTLFHLCERPDPRREQYGAMTPAQLVETVKYHLLNSGGSLVTYPGSATGKEAETIVDLAGFRKRAEHRSLQFWELP